ncbi:MAG: membrane protein insertase YidC [Pirellulales bacterium]
MDRRFALFAVLVALIFVGNQIVFSLLFPPPPKKAAPADKQLAKAEPEMKEAPKADVQAAPEEPDAEKPPQPASDKKDSGAPEKQSPAQPQVAHLRGTLGSLDQDSPYRMQVTWYNVGAAIERLELNSPHYRSLDDRSGYLGYLAPIDAPKRGGALVRVVGPGTPAAAAGIMTDDIITAIGETRIHTAVELLAALQETEPGHSIELAVKRAGAVKRLTATLGHRPLDLIRPELETRPVEIVTPKDHDPLSFLATIQQFDDRTLPADDKNQELGGVNLRDSPWEVVQANRDLVRFRQKLPRLGLEISKTFRLARVPREALADADYPAYSLMLDIEIANVDDEAHQVAYRLNGPTGLPIEGAWYASKVSHTWGGAGLRDVIVQFNGGSLEQVSPSQLAKPDYKKDWGATSSLEYIAIDAQCFSVALIPRKKAPGDIWFQSVMPTRAGAVPKDSADVRLMDVSFRLDSKPAKLAPGGPPLEHHFQIFAGPKRPALLAEYGQPGATLSDLVYYGWPVFGIFARMLSVVLHYFYSIVGNYGLAIIMLTLLVRGCMFPISRRQTVSAQRMQQKLQQLQPEMKRINEKYKNDAEKRTRATQELFRQHNYNPMDQLGGCLLMFAQLPVFMGLYRALMVDIELRQAPLFSESIRWASNLAAPDMLWNWSSVVPNFVVHGAGIFPALGPYLNILPLVTIGLFIWQQKMFMPPPADEQAAMQQKMMKYMMIFMGIMFFKVASGLCLYFIASSLWGVCERKLLPKPASQGDAAVGAAASPVKVASAPTGNGAPSGKKRQSGRK